MELEELTKSQIILLVLLVSFVTSIATGIVTVSLLAQAPPAITQTVNRVIERTIETVVPSDNQQAASVITKETTIVVKEDDLITQSISDSFSKVARIHEGEATSTPIIALGTFVKDGRIITDLLMVEGVHAVSFGDGVHLYEVVEKIPEAGIAFLSATDARFEIEGLTAADNNSLKLGQTLIGLYGARSNRVAMSTLSGTGQLTEVLKDEESLSIASVHTTINERVTPGAPLINIFGNLVGISTSVSRAESRDTFVSYSDIVFLLAESEPTPDETVDGE